MKGLHFAIVWLVAMLVLGFLTPSLVTPVLAQEPLEYRIEGVDETLEENIRAHVGSLDTDDGRNPNRLRAILLENTQNALQALGYFDSDIVVDISRDGSREVSVKIALNQPVRWREIHVQISGEGHDDPVLLQVRRDNLPQSGERLNQGAYEELKRRLRVNAISRGYFNADFPESRLEINRDAATADVRLTFDTGGRYRLGEVSFSETELSDERLYQLVQFEPGDPYSENRINQLNKRLLDTGYFANVTVRPQRTAHPDEPIPVDVQLRDNESNRVGVGVGYGTDSGARFRLNWHKPLVTSGGHSFTSSLTLAESRREWTAEYRIPENDPLDDYWVVQGGYLQESFQDKKYWTQTIGLSRQTLLSSGWWRNPFIRARSERSVIIGPGGAEERNEDQFYLVPGISFSKLSTDGGVHPYRGYRLIFDTEFSDPLLGSDTQYFKFRADGSYLFTMAEKHQLLNRLELGIIVPSDFSEVPLSTRFFAGGDQSIRGYDYNSISPEDDEGKEVGGKFLAVASTEYLYRFLPNWQAAVFVDHGGAFDECCAPRFTGAGVGIRWLLPFGNLRVDVARGLEEGGFRLHLFVGGVL